MQISPHQLKNYFKKPLNEDSTRAIWVEGNEHLIVQEHRDQLIQWAQALISSRQIYHVNANFDWASLLAETSSLNLFDTGKIFDLRIYSIHKKDLPLLLQFIQQLDDTQFLIITGEKLEKKFTQLKDFKALDTHMGLITIWPLDINQYPEWIQKYSQSQAIELSLETRQWLASQHEGNLLALKQTIDRMAIFHNNSNEPGQQQSCVISIEQVQMQTVFEAKFSIFDAVDIALSGQEVKSLVALNQLKTEGQEPTLLLWSINNAIDGLIAAHDARTRKENIRWPMYKVFGPRVGLMEKASRRLHKEHLVSTKQWCGYIDETIKGARVADVWQAFQLAFIQLANPTSQTGELIKINQTHLNCL